MENIEINEYVRTKNGVIAQFTHIETYYKDKIYWFDNTIYQDYEENISYLRDNNLEKYIKKHTFNLIDLIEEGDYVNGELVVDKLQTPCRIGKQGKKFIFTKKMNIGEGYFEEDIKSIVTKQVFESMEYKVGE